MQYNVSFTLRELREAKGINQKRLAEVLKISPSMYASIEAGTRRPSIDICFTLAALYGTSMDFIYHAYYRKHFVYHMPEHELKYAMRRTAAIDSRFLREHFKQPEKMPELPAAIQFDGSPPEVYTFMQEADARAALTGVNPYPDTFTERIEFE